MNSTVGEDTQKDSGEANVISTRDDRQDEKIRCIRGAFTPSFHRNDRVTVRAAEVELPGHSFLVVERAISGCDESVYQNKKSIWEHVPRGQVRVFFRESAYEAVGCLEGLRKFGFANVPYGPLAALRDAGDESNAVAETIAMEMLDGECGHLSAVALPDGTRYWLIGSRAAHFLVRFDVPEEDIATNCGAHAKNQSVPIRNKKNNYHGKRSKVEGKRGGAGEKEEEEEEGKKQEETKREEEGGKEEKSDSVPARVARLWRATLFGLSPGNADALHAHLSDPPRTACFDAILNGTGRLVTYGTAKEQNKEEEDEEESLRFYAVRDRDGVGLCLSPDDKNGVDALKGFGLTVVSRGERLALDAPEYAQQCNTVARQLNSKGAVVYALNRAGVVVRMWRLRAYAHALERAAQEAIVTHALFGSALRAQLQRKISKMPTDVRACLGEWEAQRIPQLLDFAAWLRLTDRKGAAAAAAAQRQPETKEKEKAEKEEKERAEKEERERAEKDIREVARRRHLSPRQGVRLFWAALQRQFGRGGAEAAEAARLNGDECDGEKAPENAKAALPDVVICVGPQGCGKSTFSRMLCALLISAGCTPCWVNQDECDGKRGTFFAALRGALTGGRYSHLVVDRMNIDAKTRADYAAMHLRGLTVVWAHADGAKALADICIARVLQRGDAHRQFSLKSLAAKKRSSHSGRRGGYRSRGGRGRGRSTDAGGADEKEEEEKRSLALLRGIVRSSARQCRVESDGPLVEVNVCDPPAKAIEKVWAALRLYGKADLPPIDTLDVSAALDMAQKYEERIHTLSRGVLYAAIQMENLEEIKALVPDAYVKGKIVQKEFHVTTKFFGGEADPVMLMRLNALLGTRITVTLTRIVSDSKGTAIVVRNNNEFPCANTYPHITIGNAKGIPPQYSNDLIASSVSKDSTCTVLDLPDGTTASGTFAFIYK